MTTLRNGGGDEAAIGTHPQVGRSGARQLHAVAPPNPSSGWCGVPPFNYGAAAGAPGSCLGDVATAAGAAQPVCSPTDVSFSVPYLHFHQVRREQRS